MNEKKFLNRYGSFWQHFNPGRGIPAELIDTAKKYCAGLTKAGVTIEKADEILSAIEEEWTEIPYSFNLVAYCRDWVQAERASQAQQEAIREARPIDLPDRGVPINPSNSPSWMIECVEKLRRNGLDSWVDLLERINAKRLMRTGNDGGHDGNQCAACADSGWVYIPSKNGVATCQCPKGQRIRTKDGSRNPVWKNGKPTTVAEATAEQCRQAAGSKAEVPF